MLGRNSPGLLLGFRHAGFFLRSKTSVVRPGQSVARRQRDAALQNAAVFFMPAMVFGRSRAQDAGHDVNRALTMPGR